MSRNYGAHTLAGSVDPAWAAMAQELNDVTQSIGMGRYQVSRSSFWFRMPLGLCPSTPPHHCTSLFPVILTSLSL
jgi:hypothetical protein